MKKSGKELFPPFQLISYEEGKFVVNNKFEKQMKKITKDIYVVGIVGKYRTGKSFFLNRLFDTQEKGGFLLGSTIESATRGVWCWAKEIDGKAIILLDTEGLYVPKTAGVNYDNKVISITLLLSSFFLLNTTGTIDRASLQQLEFVVELTKHIKGYSAKEAKLSDYKEFFPNFIWLVRDFFLELKNNKGDYLTDYEYLEEMLEVTQKDEDSLDPDIQRINRMKNYIKEMFPKRNCFTLVQPVMDSRLLSKVHEMEYEDLDSSFCTKMDILCDYVLGHVTKKKMFKNNWNGRIFFEMTKEFVDCINSNKFISIDTSFSEVVLRNNEKIFIECLKEYEEEMDKEIVKNPLPVDKKELDSLHETVLKKILEEFESSIYNEEKETVDDKKEKFLSKILKLNEDGEPIKGIYYEKFIKKNEQLSVEKCKKVFKDLWKKIDDNFQNLIKNISEYDKLLEELKTNYFNTKNLGPLKDKIFEELMEEKKEERKKLEFMNKFLKEQEQKTKLLEKEVQQNQMEMEKIREEKEEVIKKKETKHEEEKKELEKKAVLLETELSKYSKANCGKCNLQ